MKHNRRLKVLIASGFSGRPSGFFFGTLTAPGADVLPWDKSRCRHPADRPCSGKIGCQVVDRLAAAWNTCAPQAWSYFVTYLRRELKGHDVQFWKCMETQERGLLHAHAVIWCPGVTQARFRAAWNAAADASLVIAGHYQFAWGTERDVQRIGCKDSVPEIIERTGMSEFDARSYVAEADTKEQQKFTRYGAKYCTKGGKRACTYSRRTGELRGDGRGYRTWSASSRWGLRMKQVRSGQRAFAIAQGATAAGASGLPPLGGGAPGGAAALDPHPDFYTGTLDVIVQDVELSAPLV
jgi:hypothetical protein